MPPAGASLPAAKFALRMQDTLASGLLRRVVAVAAISCPCCRVDGAAKGVSERQESLAEEYQHRGRTHSVDLVSKTNVTKFWLMTTFLAHIFEPIGS